MIDHPSAQDTVKTYTRIGLYTLCKREVVRFLVVTHQTIIPPLISSMLFLFIFGLSVGKNIQFAGNQTSYLEYIIPGIITMYLISGSFENTSSSLFISRWHNHIQEILLSPLSYFEMVLGLIFGGVARGTLVALGVFTLSQCFSSFELLHPFLALYFVLTIAVIFASAGLVAALWAKDFGMLSIWGTYIITPAVFLGGVFNPISMLPETLRTVVLFNPMFYLVNGIRYSILGVSDASIEACALLAGLGAIISFGVTVYLFRIGYRLRT